MITTHKKNLSARCLERGYSLEEVMDCVVKQDGDIWTIDETHEKYPRTKRQKAIPQDGAGTELKKILSTFGIKSTENCSCNKRAKIMNEKGTEWCKENKETIVSWLEQESKARKLPFSKFLATKVLNLAIRRAEKKQNV